MEYRLRQLEYNGLKGRIGEQLARSFVRNELAAKLVKEENWNHVLLSPNDYKQHVWTLNTKLFKFDNFRKDFIVHGFCATTKLLSKYASIVGILVKNHCTPDGLLLKLRETGKTVSVKQTDCPVVIKLRATAPQDHTDRFTLPLVEGDLEVLEIKCGRSAKLMDKQKETYNSLIAKGIPLRIIKVRIVSFDLNRFLVEERKIERFL